MGFEGSATLAPECMKHHLSSLAYYNFLLRLTIPVKACRIIQTIGHDICCNLPLWCVVLTGKALSAYRGVQSALSRSGAHPDVVQVHHGRGSIQQLLPGCSVDHHIQPVQGKESCISHMASLHISREVELRLRTPYPANATSATH